MPATLRARILAANVSEVQIRDLGLLSLLHICRNQDVDPTHGATLLLQQLLRFHNPNAQRQVQDLLDGKWPTQVEPGLEDLLSCLARMDLAHLRKQVEEVARDVRMQLANYLRFHHLEFCGCTAESVFTVFENAPTPALIRQCKAFLCSQLQGVITERDCTLMIRRPRETAITKPQRDHETQVQAMFQWCRLLGLDTAHVTFSPFSRNFLVDGTTRLFLVGVNAEEVILDQTKVFDRVLWIHPSPHNVQSTRKNISLMRPAEWKASGFAVESDLIVVSLLTLALQELEISSFDLLAKIDRCCVFSDVLVSQDVAALSTPGSIFPLWSESPPLIHVHEGAGSIDYVRAQLVKEALQLEMRHTLVISSQHFMQDSQLWAWNPSTGSLENPDERKSMFTDVIIDLDFDPDALIRTFVLALSGAFAYSSWLATFHIVWRHPEVRNLVLTSAHLLNWKPVYFTRHTYFAPGLIEEVSMPSLTRLLKGQDIDKTHRRAEALSWTAEKLFSTLDFALVSSITILKRVLLLVHVSEEDFMRADGAPQTLADLNENQSQLLFLLFAQLEAHNPDMKRVNRKARRGSPLAILKRVSYMFGRVFLQIRDTKPPAYRCVK